MSRNLYRIIFDLFKKSLKYNSDQSVGKLVGKDHHGNKYFELPPDPNGGRRKSSRWFEPTAVNNYLQEIPPEWAQWLRRRREEPPTEDEIIRNLAISKIKKQNAAMKEGKEYTSQVTRDAGLRTSFPKYADEYELTPGQDKKK